MCVKILFLIVLILRQFVVGEENKTCFSSVTQNGQIITEVLKNNTCPEFRTLKDIKWQPHKSDKDGVTRKNCHASYNLTENTLTIIGSKDTNEAFSVIRVDRKSNYLVKLGENKCNFSRTLLPNIKITNYTCTENGNLFNFSYNNCISCDNSDHLPNIIISYINGTSGKVKCNGTTTASLMDVKQIVYQNNICDNETSNFTKKITISFTNIFMDGQRHVQGFELVKNCSWNVSSISTSLSSTSKILTISSKSTTLSSTSKIPTMSLKSINPSSTSKIPTKSSKSTNPSSTSKIPTMSTSTTLSSTSKTTTKSSKSTNPSSTSKIPTMSTSTTLSSTSKTPTKSSKSTNPSSTSKIPTMSTSTTLSSTSKTKPNSSNIQPVTNTEEELICFKGKIEQNVKELQIECPEFKQLEKINWELSDSTKGLEAKYFIDENILKIKYTKQTTDNFSIIRTDNNSNYKLEIGQLSVNFTRTLIPIIKIINYEKINGKLNFSYNNCITFKDTPNIFISYNQKPNETKTCETKEIIMTDVREIVFQNTICPDQGCLKTKKITCKNNHCNTTHVTNNNNLSIDISSNPVQTSRSIHQETTASSKTNWIIYLTATIVCTVVLLGIVGCYLIVKRRNQPKIDYYYKQLKPLPPINEDLVCSTIDRKNGSIKLSQVTKYLKDCIEKDVFSVTSRLSKQFEQAKQLLPTNADNSSLNCIDGYKTRNSFVILHLPTEETIDKFEEIIQSENVSVVVTIINNNESVYHFWESLYANLPNCLGISEQGMTLNDTTFRHILFVFDNVFTADFIPLVTKLLTINLKTNKILISSTAESSIASALVLTDTILRKASEQGTFDFYDTLCSYYENGQKILQNLFEYIFVHILVNDCLTRGNFIIYENYEANIKTTLRKVGLTSLIEFTDQIHLFDTVALSISQHWFKKENSTKFIKYYNNMRKFSIKKVPADIDSEKFWLLLYKSTNYLICPNELDGRETCKFWTSIQAHEHIFKEITVTAEFISETNQLKTINLHLRQTALQETKVVSVLLLKNWNHTSELPNDKNLLVSAWKEVMTKTKLQDRIVVTYCGNQGSAGLFIASCFILDKLKVEQIVDVPLAIRSLRLTHPNLIRGWSSIEYLYDIACRYNNL